MGAERKLKEKQSKERTKKEKADKAKAAEEKREKQIRKAEKKQKAWKRALARYAEVRAKQAQSRAKERSTKAVTRELSLKKDLAKERQKKFHTNITNNRCKRLAQLLPRGRLVRVSRSSATTYLKSTRTVRTNMISIFKYINAWHSEAVSSEMVELSSVISDASTMSRKLIVQHMKAGNTFAVPQSALLGTKWWHSATSGYLRIDSKSEWICWPTGCITAKCGRNTASNQRIARKSFKKVKALPHDKCRKEIIAARKEHKAKSERKWKAVKKREAQKKEQAVKSHVKKTAAERSAKVQAAKQVALQKKEVAAKLKAVKDRIERENKNMLKLEPGLRKRPRYLTRKSKRSKRLRRPYRTRQYAT